MTMKANLGPSASVTVLLLVISEHKRNVMPSLKVVSIVKLIQCWNRAIAGVRYRKPLRRFHLELAKVSWSVQNGCWHVVTGNVCWLTQGMRTDVLFWLDCCLKIKVFHKCYDMEIFINPQIYGHFTRPS